MVNFGVFFVIATSVAFWGIFLSAAVNIFRKMAGKPDVQWVNWVQRLVSEEGKSRLHIYAQIVVFALLVRLAMLVFGWFLLEMREGATLATLFQSFSRWDAAHYLTLAETGYGWQEDGRNILLVFFPLYPYLVRLVGFATDNYLVAAYIVSFTSYCAAMVYLYRLVRLDFSEKTAWWTIILISIAPHAFFFGAPYTESLFLLTTTMTLYYIRTHKWLLAGLAGAFASFTRMAGIILIVVAVVEFITHYKVREIFTKGVWILVMLAGSGAYMLLNWYISGDPLRFMYYQSNHWYNNTQYFGTTMMTQFRNIVNFQDQILINATFVPNILAFAFAIAMLMYAHAKKLNLTFIVFALGYTLVSFAPSWLLSGGRYVAACAVLFIFLAHFTEGKPWRRLVIPLACLVGLFFIMGTFINGGPVF